MYSQIILLLFGLHTISAQLKNIPPPPAIPRLDVASLPKHLQKLLTHVNDVESNLEVQGPQTISRAHTYGMSLRSGQGEVWNDITGNYTNGIASSEPISPSNRADSRDSNNYYQTAKAEETASPQNTQMNKNIPIASYKDSSNLDQSLSSISPYQTLPLEKHENGDQRDQRGNKNPNNNIPSDTNVQSQNIPVPEKLENQKFKKTPSAKTYGMNLAGGHGHVWNNIGGSHLDVNDATPSESVHPESKDKHYPAAGINANKFVSPTTLQPVVYSTTPEATSKPAIVNYKESNHNQNLPTVTTINPSSTGKSQNPVPTNEENYKIENEIKKVTSPKTYGVNLSGGHGHVWNNIGDSHFDVNNTNPSKYIQPELKDKATSAAANGDKFTLTTTVKPVVYSITPEGTSEIPTIVDNKDDTPSQSIQSELKDKTTPAATDVDKFTSTATVKPMNNKNPEAKSEEPAFENYKESNHNQNVPTFTTIKPTTAVASQNPVPTNIKDYKAENGAKKYPSPKTYGMNLSAGHGHVWNNIDESHVDINKTIPSQSVQPELKDKTTPVATNGEKLTWTTPVKPVVYSITPESTSDKPAIVDNKDATPSQSVQSEIKDKTTPAAKDVDKFTLSSTVKPMYNTNIEAKSEEPALENYKESNHNQNLPTFTTIKPATAVTSQNSVPTNLQDYKAENGAKKYPSPKTYGMNLSAGHGHVWNNIDESHVDINKTTPSQSVQPELKDKTTPAAKDVDKFTLYSTVKPMYNTNIEAKSEEPALENYKESNHNQNLPTFTTIKPATAVTSQNSVPTNLQDYKAENGAKKYPSPKTYGMNLSAGHGHVWNNIDASHVEINKTTPSQLVQSELKDKTTPVATNGDNFTWTTSVKPVVYTTTPQAASEKPAIVNYKDATPSESAQLESKDKATTNYDLTSTTILKPIVYTMSPEAASEKPEILSSVTTTNSVITVNSQNPVSPKAADQKFENGIKKIPSSKTYGMNLSGGHGYVWNNIGGSLEHFDDNRINPSKLIEPEDKTIPAPTNTVANFKDSNKFYQESPSVTTVNLATYPYYTTSETLTENATRISNPYRSYNENIPSVTTPQTLTEKAPTYVNTQKDDEHQNQVPLSKSYSNKINTSNKDILKRASPRTYGMRLEGDHGYVWNDLIEPRIHYNLDEETNDSNNTTTANDENSSEVPVTKKPTEDVTSANVDPISKNYTETLPVSTAQPSTDSYRITSTERNKNNDSSSDGSSELEPEDDLLKYIEKLVKDEVAKLLESIKEKNPDKVPVTTEKSNNGNETINIEAPDTENPTEVPNTSNISTTTEKVNEKTVSVTTERWTEPTSTEAFGKPSTKTPKVNDTTEADDTEKNPNSNKVKPESNEELKKYIEKLVREEVAKRLENVTKTDNINDTAIKQDDKKPLKDNANNTLDNIPKNVTNFYGSLIGEGNVTNIFIFYPNDKSLESIVNDAKNIIKPQKNKSNDTEADDNKNRPTEAPSTLTTEASTTTNTERPVTESTNTPDVTTSTEKDNPTISVTTENSTDSTTSEPKTDSSTDSYETTTIGSPNTTTEANNKKDGETPELKEEIKKYIDKLVKDEVADQLDKERKNRIEKDKEPEVIPATTEKSNDTTSTESPTSEKNTEASDSTTSTEQDHETTSESTEKSNNDTNNIMSTEPPTTEEASTQSNDTPNINSTTEANTKNEDGSPPEPKMPVSAEELKKYVDKLVKDEVAKLLNADKNNGSKKENKTDIIPLTTEKANNDSTDTMSTESSATEKSTEAPDSTNTTTTTSIEQDSETTPVTTENSNNDSTDTTSTESTVTENNTGTPDSTNATTSSEDDRKTNLDPTEKSNNDTNDAMSTESPTTEVSSTQSSENTTTETPNINSSTEANTKNEDDSPSEPKMPVSADELKKYVEKLVKDEVAKQLDAVKNNESKNENEPDVIPVTTEKSNNETTDGMSTESPATEKSTEAPDSTDATTSSENGNDATVTTEKSNNDTPDTQSTEPPATEENTEAPDSTDATSSSEKDNTTPVTTEGSTESSSEANKEQASTESSNATSTTETNKENDETTSSNITPTSKEEIKKYVEQLVKEEVAKLMAAGKNDASKNEDAKPANATDEDAAPVTSDE